MKNAFLTLFFSLFCAYEAFSLAADKGGISGASACPMAAALLMAAFSLGDLLWTHCRGKRGKKDSPDVSSRKPDLSLGIFFKLAFASAIYALLMPHIGFVVSTGLYCAAVLWIFSYRDILVSLAFGYAGAAILYFVFSAIMKVALPAGFLN